MCDNREGKGPASFPSSIVPMPRTDENTLSACGTSGMLLLRCGSERPHSLCADLISGRRKRLAQVGKQAFALLGIHHPDEVGMTE